VVAALAVIAAAFGLILTTAFREPRVDGRTIEQWLQTIDAGESARLAAESAIVRMGATNAIPRLAGLLHLEERPLKQRVIDFLRARGLMSSQTVPAHVVRSRAARALGALGKDAFPVLMTALDDPYENVRASVHVALVSIDPYSREYSQALLERIRQRQHTIEYLHYLAFLASVADHRELKAAIPDIEKLSQSADTNLASAASIALFMIGMEPKSTIRPRPSREPNPYE
jgi:HEAT repeat protein